MKLLPLNYVFLVPIKFLVPNVCIPKREKVKKRAGCCFGSISLLLYLKQSENYVKSLLTKQKNKTGFWACNCEDFEDKEKSTQRTQYFITAAERQNILTEPSEGSDI